MADINDLEPLDSREEEIGVAKELMKKDRSLSKRFFYALIVVILIVGSFWGSFYIGRLILSSTKNLPESEFEQLDEQFAQQNAPVYSTSESEVVMSTIEMTAVETGENPVSSKQTSEASFSKVASKNPFVESKEVPKTNKTAPQKEFTASNPRSSNIAKSVSAKSKTYIVRSSIFDDKDQAKELAEKISSDGFETFVKEVRPGIYFVQFGVFKSYENAKKLANQLSDFGYKAVIVP